MSGIALALGPISIALPVATKGVTKTFQRSVKASHLPSGESRNSVAASEVAWVRRLLDLSEEEARLPPVEVRLLLQPEHATSGLALVFLLIPRFRAGGIAVLAAAIAIGVGVAYVPLHWLQNARAAAAINDVTTDTANPPAFVAVLPLRATAPVPAAYPGSETANAQRRVYPDILPLELAVPPAAAFARALDATTAMGWAIVAVRWN